MKNDKKLKRFLELKDFDAYLENYAFFCGLKKDGNTFKKQQELMENDPKYSHREKEKLIRKKEKELINGYKEKIASLLDEIEEESIWKLPIRKGKAIPFFFNYPNDRKGDISYFLSALYYDPIKKIDGRYLIEVERSDYKLLELLILSSGVLFGKYRMQGNDKALSFLKTYNRVCQIEDLMAKIDYYKDEYRSLHSIPDLRLKNFLQDYHRTLKEKTSQIYQYLIKEGLTSPRWKSEQKAYAIVRSHYPDALFQYQPDFLFGQRIDIFIPSMNTAIEYQGRQHYEAIDFFGGEQGLKNNRARDARKARRCKEKGITLLYWDHDEELSETHFLNTIKPKIEKRSHSTDRRNKKGERP